MSTVIKIKRSETSGISPGNLALGELAVNIPDKKIWVGDSSDSPILLYEYDQAVNNYTGGEGISISTNNEIDLNLIELSTATSIDKYDKVPFLDITSGGSLIGQKLISATKFLSTGLSTALSTAEWDGQPETNERITVAVQDENPNAFVVETLQNATGQKANIIRIDTSVTNGSHVHFGGTEVRIEPADGITIGVAPLTINSTGNIELANASSMTFSLDAGTLNGITTIVSGSTGQVGITGNLAVSGNVTINGTTTTLNSTTLTVDDKNIELGSTASPSDASADGGGITLKGTTDKTIIWDDTNDNWTSSEHLNVASGKVYKINNTEVLSATTLGSAVTGSSLTSVGTITSGTWSGTAVGLSNGGTNANITAVAGGIAYGSHNAINLSSAGVSGQLLQSAGSGTPTWVNIASVSGFDEAVQDTSSSMITGGSHTGISASYNDGSGTVSLTNTGVLGVSGTSPIVAVTDENNNVSVSHATSGVSASTYGSATAVPVVTVNSSGHVTSAVNTNISIASSAVSDFTEAVQDTSAGLITGASHTGISASYNDSAGTLALTNTGVLSVNGATGAISNVAMTNGDVTFSGTVTATRLFIDDRLVFEGAVDDDYHTRLVVEEPTDVRVITLPDTSGTVLLDTTGVQTFNGAVGAITGVNSINGLTGTAIHSIHAGLLSGKYYFSTMSYGSLTSDTNNAVANRLALSPFYIPVATTINTVGWRTPTNANASGKTFKIGIYNNNYSTGKPTTLISTIANGVSVPTSANTDVEVTSLGLSLAAGLYWIGIIFDTTANASYVNNNFMERYLYGSVNSANSNYAKGLYYDVGSYTLASDLTSVSFYNDTWNRTVDIYMKV